MEGRECEGEELVDSCGSSYVSGGGRGRGEGMSLPEGGLERRRGGEEEREEYKAITLDG